MMESTLREGLPGLNIELSEQVQKTLCDFGKAVVEQNKVMNLTAITEPDQVAKLHLLDSLSVLSVQDLTEKKVIDVGCGAGFPGVPLKIACPDMKLTLLDSLGKRMNWLQEVLAWMPNVSPPGQRKLLPTAGRNTILPPAVLWQGCPSFWS